MFMVQFLTKNINFFEIEVKKAMFNKQLDSPSQSFSTPRTKANKNDIFSSTKDSVYFSDF